MASSGSFKSSQVTDVGEWPYYVYVSWSTTQSRPNNTTTLAWKCYGGSYNSDTSRWTMMDDIVVKINGTTVLNQTSEIQVTKDKLLGSGSITVAHNSDGTKSIPVSISAKIYYTGNSVSPNSTYSGTISLNTIPRASTITSADNITLGNNCKIKWTPANSSFKYKIKFSLGNWNYTTGFINPNTTSAYTYTGYTISGTTTANNTTIYAQLPNSTSGTMTAVLTTYNSSGTQIGSANSKTFTVTIPNSVVPTVGTIALDPVNITTADGTSRNVLVQNKNKISVNVSGCSAGNGSSIKSYTFSGPGISSTTTNTSVSGGPVSTAGTLKYTVKVTDSRGRTASKESAGITCYPYTTPSFKSFEAYRSDSSGNANDSGTYIKCSYSLDYSSINSTNNVTVKILYKKSTASSYSSVTSLTNSTSTSGSQLLSSIDVASTYIVYATITDNYSGTSSSTTVTVFGTSRILNILRDGTGVAFGKMAEQSELFESRYRIKAPGLLSSRGTRPTNANIDADNNYLGCIEHYLASDNMANNKPPLGSGHILHFHWDNTTGYDSQLYLHNTDGVMMSRGCNAGTWGSWAYIPQATTLYSGAGTTGTVTLSSSAANFSYLEIFYMDNNDRGLKSTRVSSPDGKTVELGCIEPSSTSGVMHIRVSFWVISGQSITHSRSKHAQFSNGQSVAVDDNQHIKITRVVGYK